jgi:uncharacterized phage protein (TIGR01671 family)
MLSPNDEMDDGFAHPEHREKSVIMEFTGFQDSKGKEIYEGDIIDYGYYSKEDDTEDLSRPMRFVAKWSQEDSGFVANGRLMTRYQYYAFPVIGNIYENPDLLEEKKGE